MGCLPAMLLFLIGFGVGYLVDGRSGAAWGAGFGLALGVLAGLAMTWMMRGRR